MKKGEVFLNFCLAHAGYAYHLGASGKDFKEDCSGLMMQAAKEIGVSFYHGATTAYNRLCAAGYENGEVSKLNRSRLAILFHADATKAGVMAHTGLHYPNGRIVQSGGRWGKGTHTNPLYNNDWTRYVILPQFDEEYEGEPNHPLMVQGALGYWVVKLQTQLEKLGYQVGGIDGKFGPITLAAVKRFQAMNGIKADGIIGKDTIKKLYAAPSFLHTVTVKHCTVAQLEKIKALCTNENEMTTESE